MLGEIRESDHINCLHWNYDINLTAWREGSLWRIYRSDTGQTASQMANLEFAWWNDEEGNSLVKELKAYWNGDDFTLHLSNDQAFRDRIHVLNYLGQGHDGKLAMLLGCAEGFVCPYAHILTARGKPFKSDSPGKNWERPD